MRERATAARPSGAPGMIAARLVLRVVEHCRARGHDAERLCASAGISPAALAEPQGRVPYELAERVGMRALELTRDPCFGLSLARGVGERRHLDAGMLMLMASPNVRAALLRLESNQRYWGDGTRTTLHAVRGGLVVRYELPGARGEYARHADECALAEVVVGVRALTGAAIAPRRVRFRHAAPPSTEEHARLFGCPIAFGCAHSELELDDAALDAPMEHANATFLAVFEEQVERALARLGPSPRASDRVREAVRGTLAGGRCSLSGTARVLRVSERTLQRRLHGEGTSFAELVDALRRELAVAYLERQLTVAEVASLLGYSDATAFHHAFRRWTGESPSRFARGAPADPPVPAAASPRGD